MDRSRFPRFDLKVVVAGIAVSVMVAATGAASAPEVGGLAFAVRHDPVNQDAAAPSQLPGALPSTAPAQEVARGFVEAWGGFDADGAISYLGDDADISGLIDWFTTEEVQGTRDELRLLISLLEAQDYQQTLEMCLHMSSTTLRCTFDFQSLRSVELGLGRYRGSYFDLTIRDGAIVLASMHLEMLAFSHEVWEPFADWLDANHPDDAAIIYSSPDAGGARLIEEAIPLWERLLGEYVDSRLAGDTRVGFVGLPPVGATPSAPERGELVVYVAGPDRGSRTWVYADGRLIWHRHANIPEGANPRFTGFLEQRLTPEGVELMRSEIVSLLDDAEPSPDSPQACWWALCEILVRNNGRVVRVPWPGDDSRVLERITDPASWLPVSGWEDPEIGAYVPSRYRVDHWPENVTLLPEAAQDLLEDHVVTTEELRALVEVLEGAGLEPVSLESSLTFQIETGDDDTADFHQRDLFVFEPYLPHGQVYCQHCG